MSPPILIAFPPANSFQWMSISGVGAIFFYPSIPCLWPFPKAFNQGPLHIQERNDYLGLPRYIYLQIISGLHCRLESTWPENTRFQRLQLFLRFSHRSLLKHVLVSRILRCSSEQAERPQVSWIFLLFNIR